MDVALFLADKPVYFGVSWAMHPTSSDHTELSQRPTSQTHPNRFQFSYKFAPFSHILSQGSKQHKMKREPQFFEVFSVPKNFFLSENLRHYQPPWGNKVVAIAQHLQMHAGKDPPSEPTQKRAKFGSTVSKESSRFTNRTPNWSHPVGEAESSLKLFLQNKKVNHTFIRASI